MDKTTVTESGFGQRDVRGTGKRVIDNQTITDITAALQRVTDQNQKGNVASLEQRLSNFTLSGNASMDPEARRDFVRDLGNALGSDSEIVQRLQ